MSHSRLQEIHTSSALGIFHEKSTEDKTKNKYEKALKLGTNTEEGNKQLKKTILSGEGPYVAFAANLMCIHIENNTVAPNIGGSSTHSKNFETREQYLAQARNANKVIGLYFTVLAMLRDCERLGGYDRKANLYQEILSKFIQFEIAMKEDAPSYQLLSTEINKEQDSTKNKLRSKIKEPDPLEETDSDDEDETLLIEAKFDSLSLASSPLSNLKFRLMKAEINPEGDMAKNMRRRLQPEDKQEPKIKRLK